jgi:hypothetical protein
MKKPIDFPVDVAKAFVEDMHAYFDEPDGIKRDEIAARQAWLLGEHMKGKVRLSDVISMFEAMKDEF